MSSTPDMDTQTRTRSMAMMGLLPVATARSSGRFPLSAPASAEAAVEAASNGLAPRPVLLSVD
jgi:hypothetical protein